MTKDLDLLKMLVESILLDECIDSISVEFRDKLLEEILNCNECKDAALIEFSINQQYSNSYDELV